ncbi:hypothetical protein EVC00_003 [Rhizobium phage RHph_N37]|uniref:Uncharacterized protein n=1 Tax=Rhizobium phage RHph_N37 TaxID=2509749 RepID=A0A7S5RIT1_9CAUD|nr:hypothetical protein EVC00_003 [Rhizobium phage RHph_N37]
MSTFERTVHDFYKDYAKWVFNPDDETIFVKRLGLCDNLYRYFEYYYGTNYSTTFRELVGIAYDHYYDQLLIMRQHFKQHSLDTVYPFDTEASYMDAAVNHTQHLNEKRRAFVFAMSHDNQSDMLGMFYRWLVDELEIGSIVSARGVCNYLDTWVTNARIPYAAYRELLAELKAQFEATYANDLAPFNGNIRGFWSEQDRRALWTNPKRVEWVRAHAKLVQ